MARPSLTPRTAQVLAKLKRMRTEEGMQIAAIHREYKAWCEDNGQAVGVSDESLRKWAMDETIPGQIGTFADFALARADAPNPRHMPGRLAHAVNTLFPSGNVDPSATLNRLNGEFELIRRLWSPIGSDACIRCKASFREQHGVMVYREEQRFLSLYEVNETYEGYAFMFGSSFWILAHENERKSLNFLTIHETAPSVTASAGAFEFCQGNLIAVSGRGPNTSHRFVLKKRRGNPRYGIVNKADAMKEFDNTTIDYLYNNDEDWL